MEKVADGVYQVKKAFRAYIVDGDAGVTLIDAGLPKRAAVFTEALASIGRSITDVRSIVITHSHFDHTGSAAQLKRESGAELYCSPADTPAVDGREPVPTPPFLDRTPLQLLKPVFGFLPKGEPTEVDHQIGDGAVLHLPEDLTAVATPGHTPGHTSYLLDRAGGILFVGDAASHKGGDVIFGWFNRRTPAITRAIRTLADRDFAIACFGHADPLIGGASAAFQRFAATL